MMIFKKSSLVLAILATLAGGNAAMLGSANANSMPAANPYPYPHSTYWAWQNRPDLPANLGPAVNWNDAALAQGWPVGQYPRKGDIAVLEAGVYGAPSTGHVAVVEQVLDDGSFITSQMDDTDCQFDSSTCGRINRRAYPIMRGMSFIHTMKDTRSTWSFASGAAGWTARDLGDGYMGGPGWYYPLTATSNDPQLISPELDVPLDSYGSVEVTMAIGVPVTDPSVQIYFTTDSQPNFSEDKSFKLKAQADGQLYSYVADFSTHPAWKGHITRLRLDPTGPGKAGGVRVDQVRLLSQIGPGSPGIGTFSAMEYRPERGGRPASR